MSDRSITLVDAVRTPIGHYRGQLSSFSAPQLASFAIRGLLQRIDLEPKQIDEVILGCVLMAGIGQAPARQAMIGAEIPDYVPATTVNKVCGSGMKSLIQACDQIRAGSDHHYLVGGMESMSNAPKLVADHLGDQPISHLFYDGLTDPYSGKLMGEIGQQHIDRYKYSREQLDQFAVNSIRKAWRAQKERLFTDEIVCVTKGDLLMSEDELSISVISEQQIEQYLRQLKPVFTSKGSLTMANSSSLSDGAAVMLVSHQPEAAGIARIVDYSGYASAPDQFPSASTEVIRKLLTKVGWSVDDVDLFEINEAFASVPLYAIKTLKLDPDKVNIHGGACALGHPIGASGARIVVTLAHALKTYGLKRGIASICIGGGEATAIALER